MCKLSKLWKWLLILVSVFIIVVSILALWYYFASKARYVVRRFPDGFLFGVATSSYQIEGAWNEDGKSESVWDVRTHSNSCFVSDCSNADIAADSYHLYKRDVQMMRELGIDFYRFSLSWSRLLPTGLPDQINAGGVNFYNNYIDEMIKYNITPMVTLFHWDIPQRLQELGGLSNPHIGDWFADYARIAFRLFGDRVKFWYTINEPELMCRNEKTVAIKNHLKAGNTTRALAEFSSCYKDMLMVHARMWRIYDEEYRFSQRGNISITISTPWYEPENKHSKLDVEVADRLNQICFSTFDPIFSETGGGFPPLGLKNLVPKSEGQEDYDFTDEERTYIRGTSDYFGLIHYYTMFVSSTTHKDKAYYGDFSHFASFTPRKWHIDRIVFTERTTYTSWGFYKVLIKIREKYNNWPVFVLENGFKTQAGLQDDARITHLRGYLAAMLDAIDEGVDVRGYTFWSLMDGFEWTQGYTAKFGLYEVDMADPERTRRPRKSAFVYKHIVRSRTLDPRHEPDIGVMTIDPGH